MIEKITNKNPKWLALERLEKNGYMGMTIKDLINIDHSLIHNILGLDDSVNIKNSDPDKTLGELLNDKQINIYIEKNRDYIKTHEYPYPDPEGGVPYRERLTGMTASSIRAQVEIINNQKKKELNNSIKYLKSIGRLSKDFSLGDITLQ